jgi:hypothetical protein
MYNRLSLEYNNFSYQRPGTTMQHYIDLVEFTLKRNLKVGEKVSHTHLGACTFSETCKAMEERSIGDRSSVFLDNARNETIEVSVNLITRVSPSGLTYRMNQESKLLDEALAEAKVVRRLEPADIHSLVNNINQHLQFIPRVTLK